MTACQWQVCSLTLNVPDGLIQRAEIFQNSHSNFIWQSQLQITMASHPLYDTNLLTALETLYPHWWFIPFILLLKVVKQRNIMQLSYFFFLPVFALRHFPVDKTRHFILTSFVSKGKFLLELKVFPQIEQLRVTLFSRLILLVSHMKNRKKLQSFPGAKLSEKLKYRKICGAL